MLRGRVVDEGESEARMLLDLSFDVARPVLDVHELVMVAFESLDLLQLRPVTDFFVVHDSEDLDSYGLRAIMESFKHRWDLKIVTPWTSIVSDTTEIPLPLIE